ncbi:MAG: hypothetical protein ACRDIY_24050 [Chloroflexota bacterium]
MLKWRRIVGLSLVGLGTLGGLLTPLAGPGGARPAYADVLDGPGVSGIPIGASGEVGVDVSFPQCGNLNVPTLASNGAPYTFAIIGVNHGRAFTQNTCLADEYQALSARGYGLGFVMNLNSPRGQSLIQGQQGPRGTCALDDLSCLSYNDGWNAAQDAYTYTLQTLANIGVTDLPRSWFMDIEETNYWSSDLSLNDQVLQGAIDFLSEATGFNLTVPSGSGTPPVVAVYSVPAQWARIAGPSYQPAVVGWTTGARSLTTASRLCSTSLVGGATQIVQHWNPSLNLDEDDLC